jgi:hypothetical protein
MVLPMNSQRAFRLPERDVRICVLDQEMNVVGFDHIIENRKTVRLLALEYPMQTAPSIAHEGLKNARSYFLNEAYQSNPSVNSGQVFGTIRTGRDASA